MKNIVIILFIILNGFLLVSPVKAQSCDECKNPNVALYDFEMKVEKPQNDSLALKWLNLFWVGIKARYSLRNNDPNSGCIQWMDGAMINANLLQNGALKAGGTYTNLPPAGALKFCDYIIYGSVNNSGGIYIAELKLETAESREVVKTVTETFSNEGPGALDCGEKMAVKMGSLFTTIRNFEKYKRDTDPYIIIRDNYSADDDEIKVKPLKTKVSAGDTVDVDIESIDCDGVALAGRVVYLTEVQKNGELLNGPVNGKFTKDMVVLDENGRARVGFVPERPGTAILYVSLPHSKPTGKKYAFIGQAYLNIPPECYELKAVYTLTRKVTGDTSWSVADETGWAAFRSNIKGSVDASIKITGLFERDYSIDAGYKNYTKIISMKASGTPASSFNTYKVLNTPSASLPMYETEEIKSSADKTSLSGYILIPKNSGEIPTVDIAADVIYQGKFTSREYSLENGWINNNREINKDNLSSFNSGYDLNFTVDDSNKDDKNPVNLSGNWGFIWTNEKTTNGPTGYLMCYAKTVEQEKWVINITPKGDITSVEEKNDNNLPGKFILYQNYPNPFNPSTKIKYSVAKPGQVSITVYDILGRQIVSLVNEEKPSGEFEIVFDAGTLAGGVYFYVLKSNDGIITKKMCIVK